MNPPTAFGEVFASGDVDGQALKLAVVDGLPCGVIIVDTAGHVVLQHGALAGDPVASGASDGSHNIRAIGPRRLDSGLPPPPDPEQFADALAGKVVPEFEYSYRLPGDVQDRWAVAVASPLHDVTDRITGAVAIYNDITARKRREETLKRAHDFGSAVVNTAGCLVVVHDRQGRVELFNQACEHTTGYRLAEVLGMQTWDMFIPPDELDGVQTAYRRLEAGDYPVSHENYLLCKDGSRRLIAWSNTVLLDKAGAPSHFVCSGIDITDRHDAEVTLRASEQRLSLQYETTSILVSAASLDDAIPQLLKTICTRLGWEYGAFWSHEPREQILNRRYAWHDPSTDGMRFNSMSEGVAFGPGVSFLGTVWADGKPSWVADVSADAHSPFAAVASARNVHAGLWFPVTRRSGVYGVMEFFSDEILPPNAELLQALGTIGALVGQFVDRVKAEEALTQQALHDQLTGLPNRALLSARLNEALDAARVANSSAALLLLDLNRFKEVNDTLGHHYGDLVLQEVGTRVRSVVRESATLARLGGDEFAVVLPAADFATAVKVARTILALLDMPYMLEDHSIDVGASLGISLFPEHGVEPGELLRRADVAMYIAKDTGGGYEVYSSVKDHHSVTRLTLAGDLRQALAEDQLRLYFQPLLTLPEGKITGVEVLVRWQHPKRGLILPEHFIPLAETTGLIGVLTLWVLEAALRQCNAWHEAGYPFGISVNLSMRTLQDAQLPDTVDWLLRRYNVAPERLTLEITESTLMADPLRALSVLSHLATIGVRIAIDDFGTGYSSLAYLKNLPVHEIKIDKSFVLGMGSSTKDTAIVRSVIELGHNLGMQVVAEGVEHKSAWNVLASMGCDIVQGNLMSLPIPAAELEAWVVAAGGYAAAAQSPAVE